MDTFEKPFSIMPRLILMKKTNPVPFVEAPLSKNASEPRI
jgi:hypothetical protein